jgi:hypothetical protein
MSHDVRFAREIDAAPEVVFDALTRPGGQEAFTGRTTRAGSSSQRATFASAACGA